MQYSFEHNGATIDLPPYSYGIDDKIEAIWSKQNDPQVNTRGIGKVKYEFISGLIGHDETVSLIGEFENSDPNEVQIVYDKICQSYADPATEYSNSKLDKLDSAQLEKMLELIERANNINNPLAQVANSRQKFARIK